MIHVGPLLLQNELFDPNAHVTTPIPRSLALPGVIWTFIGGEEAAVYDPTVPGKVSVVLDEHGNPIYQNVPNEFSEELIEWARRCRRRHLKWGPPEPTVLSMLLAERELMREWWRTNKGHFLRRDFKAVRPGSELPEPKNASADSITPIAPADLERPTENRQVPPSSESRVNRPTAVTTVAQPSSASSALLWTGAIATIALLAGLLFFLKRRA